MEEPIIIDTQLYDDSEYEPLRRTLEMDNRKVVLEIFKGASYEFGKVFEKLDEKNRMKLSARYIKLYCASHKCEDCPLWEEYDNEGECITGGTYYSPSEWDI